MSTLHCCIASVIFSCLLPSAHAQSTFCAVSVTILNASGKQMLTGSAKLISPSGEAIDDQKVESGVVRFCDFGPGDHSIQIESGSCQTTTIGRVRMLYRFPQALTAIVNCIGGTGDGSGNACYTFVRVRTSDQHALRDVIIESDKQTRVTDEYGRTDVSVPRGKTQTFHVQKVGFVPRTLVLACSEERIGTIEAVVVLIKEPRK